MTTMTDQSNYDIFASIYNKHWGDFVSRIFPTLEILLLDKLPNNANIIDICCGSGQLASLLSKRGFQVTGLDCSEEMINIAKDNSPEANFIVKDARFFNFTEQFHAAVSTYDSLNHILSLDELKSAFENIYRCLLPDGKFLFDLNMEDAFHQRWHGTIHVQEEDYLCVMHCSFLKDEKIARNDIRIFQRDQMWQPQKLELFQKCYSKEEIVNSLLETGFSDIQVFDAKEDLKLTIGGGRSFFLCSK